MTDLIFSFDTEDYINYDVADDILKVAQLLRKNGIKGSYQIVGLMAEALVEWGRQDIIDELSKYHEIGLHSHRHTMHPTIDEYTDLFDFNAAYELFLEDESIGLDKLRRIFGFDGTPASACPPATPPLTLPTTPTRKWDFQFTRATTSTTPAETAPFIPATLPPLNTIIQWKSCFSLQPRTHLNDLLKKR